MKLTFDAEVGVNNKETGFLWWLYAEVQLEDTKEDIKLTVKPNYIDEEKHQLSNPLQIKFKLDDDERNQLKQFLF